MTLEISVDPELTAGLRDQILDCWTDVSQAGGAVGFVPPVTKAEIARELGVSPESVRQSYAKARKNLGRFYGRRKKR